MCNDDLSFENSDWRHTKAHLWFHYKLNVQQVRTKKKAEIQALSSFGFQYITEKYLPKKLREGDWI